MTPEECQLRDAFLAECWRPVREYHQTDGERAAAWGRNTQGADKPVDRAADQPEKVA